MTWIKTIPLSEAGPQLRQALAAQQALYPAEYGQSVPAADSEKSESIVATHSLIPEALHHAFSTFGVLMSPTLPLTRRQHELITTVVSVANRCHF